MRTMRKPTVKAICCSDIHLSLKPPVARAGEDNWLDAQARPLQQLKSLAVKHKAPILCAGDIFDRWNSPPELINFAIRHLPEMYAIPGQHDLPHHNMETIQRSAYWTLVEAGVIHHTIGRHSSHGIHIQGFPWGKTLEPCVEATDDITIALVHKYIWIKGTEYVGAPKEGKVAKWEELDGWDVAAFGDNHKGFLTRRNGTAILNCGGFQRRHSDQIDYAPQVGLVMDDGTVEPYALDCSSDIIVSTAVDKRTVEDGMELKGFLEELTKLQESELDFVEAIKRAMDERECSTTTRRLILEAME